MFQQGINGISVWQSYWPWLLMHSASLWCESDENQDFYDASCEQMHLAKKAARFFQGTQTCHSTQNCCGTKVTLWISSWLQNLFYFRIMWHIYFICIYSYSELCHICCLCRGNMGRETCLGLLWMVTAWNWNPDPLIQSDWVWCLYQSDHPQPHMLTTENIFSYIFSLSI